MTVTLPDWIVPVMQLVLAIPLRLLSFAPKKKDNPRRTICFAVQLNGYTNKTEANLGARKILL